MYIAKKSKHRLQSELIEVKHVTTIKVNVDKFFTFFQAIECHVERRMVSRDSLTD